jgi:hypothetical protein
MFTAVLGLKSRVVLTCFFFPSHRMLLQTADSFGLERKVSTGGQLVWQAWCALKVNTYIQVCQVCCVMCSLNTCYVPVRALFMYDVSDVAAVCFRHTFIQLLQQTDRHTPNVHILCVCVWQNVTSFCYINHCHLYLILLCATRKYISRRCRDTFFKHQTPNVTLTYLLTPWSRVLLEKLPVCS